MIQSEYKHIYGPVPSRRLGWSLGIDLVPFKVCSYDCIYCQLGRTTNLTIKRKEYIPPKEIIADLKLFLRQEIISPDYISIAGSGEPTLNLGLEQIVSTIKEITEIPVAILTNSSLFFMPEVRKACLKADIVLPSFDAGDETIFRHINRPHQNIVFQEIAEGIVKFREEYSGQIWLEVFILAGINNIPSEIDKIKPYIERIRPDKIQLNTSVRPTAEDYAYRTDQAALQRIADTLGEKAEVIADFSRDKMKSELEIRKNDILKLLKRRPCSIEDLSLGLQTHRNNVIKHLEMLLSDGKIKKIIQNGESYYLIDN